MKLVLIPLSLLLFVIIFPMAEYNIDCPTAITDPDGNEACTHLKHQLWNVITIFSLTIFEEMPGDNLFYEPTRHPDVADRNIYPTLIATILVFIKEKREKVGKKRKEKTYKFSKKSQEEIESDRKYWINDNNNDRRYWIDKKGR